METMNKTMSKINNKLKKKLREWKGQNTDGKLRVMNIVIIVLAIIMAIALMRAVGEFYDIFTGYYTEEYTFIHSMENEEYGRMVEAYHDNCRKGYGDKEELQEYYAVARYYEAAFYYKMYLEADDVERMEVRKIAMEDAYTQMGDFAFVKESIDRQLGLAE